MTGGPAMTLCLGATLYCVGMIWTLQLIHYPLYLHIPTEAFGDYMKEHNKRLFVPVVLPSVVALLSSSWLAFQTSRGVPAWMTWSVLTLNVVILLTTAAIQGPAHTSLARDGFSEPVIRRIMTTNWIRTIAWSMNGALLLTMSRLSAMNR